MSTTNKKYILNLIESNFDTSQWNYKGMHLWPVFKSKVHIVGVGKTNKVNRISRSLKFLQYLSALIHIISLFLLKPFENRKTIYLAGLASRKNYNRFSLNELFFEYQEESKLSGAGFINIEYGYQRDKKPDYFDGKNIPFTRIHNLLSKLASFRFSIQELSYPENEVIEFLKLHNIDNSILSLFTLSTLIPSLNRLEGSKIAFEKLILNKTTQELYLINSYNLISMGFIYAAQLKDIKSIEIQHGIINEDHVCYSLWNEIPKGGYNTFPSDIYVWDEWSRVALQQLNEKSETTNICLVGHPWISKYSGIKKGHSHLFNDYKVREKRKNILVTLQPVNEILPSFFYEFIELYGNESDWHIRLHPAQKQDVKVLEQIESIFEGTRFNFQDASAYPLPEILSKMDVHITQWSSCTIEAQMMKVPTVLIHENGRKYFNEYLSDPLINIIEDVETLHSFVSDNKAENELYEY